MISGKQEQAWAGTSDKYDSAFKLSTNLSPGAPMSPTSVKKKDLMFRNFRDKAAHSPNVFSSHKKNNWINGHSPMGWGRSPDPLAPRFLERISDISGGGWEKKAQADGERSPVFGVFDALFSEQKVERKLYFGKGIEEKLTGGIGDPELKTPVKKELSPEQGLYKVTPSGGSSNQVSTALQPRTRKVSKIQTYQTPQQRVKGFFDENFHDGTEEKSAAKGLKCLSKRVKELVEQRKKTSYKEVADLLVEEAEQKGSESREVMGRHAQNVKRRVYDALNVLVASGVLTRNQKLVTKKVDTNKDKEERDLARKSDILRLQFTKQQKRVKEREKELDSLVFKFHSLNALMNRNKKINDSTMHLDSKGAIKMPFLLVSSGQTPEENDSQSTFEIDMHESKRKLNIQSSGKLEIRTAVDTIVLLSEVDPDFSSYFPNAPISKTS